MRKTRAELVKMVREEAQLPKSTTETEGYLSREQLLELLVVLGSMKNTIRELTAAAKGEQHGVPRPSGS